MNALTQEGQNRKTILITGTSTGLGRRTALYFADHGWNVAATMRRPDREMELSKYENIQVIGLDVTQPDSVKAAVKKTADAFGSIDVVVNNAGVGMYGALEVTADQDIDQQYAVNVGGIIDVTKATLPYFRKQKAESSSTSVL
jgi:NAD(P)-dependent dehydrogenase (short-subunit alcohol dehydrogenase family)